MLSEIRKLKNSTHLTTQLKLKEEPYAIRTRTFNRTIITAISNNIMDNIQYFRIHSNSWSWLMLLLIWAGA